MKIPIGIGIQSIFKLSIPSSHAFALHPLFHRSVRLVTRISLSFCRTGHWMAICSRWSRRRLHRRASLLQGHWKWPAKFHQDSLRRFEISKRDTRFAWSTVTHRTSSDVMPSFDPQQNLWEFAESSTPRFSPLHLKSLQALWNQHLQVNVAKFTLKLGNLAKIGSKCYVLFLRQVFAKHVTRITRCLHFAVSTMSIIFNNITSQKPVTHRRVSAISCWHVPPTFVVGDVFAAVRHMHWNWSCLLQPMLGFLFAWRVFKNL